jgi:hypothetical protein
MFYSEAERLFYEDMREKKRTASGVHHKTGKKGYVGKMLFPTDIMSRKDKYNHRKAGKVMSSNIYDEIITIDKFNELEDFEKRNRMAYWRSNYTNKEIKSAMGIANSPYYKIVSELGLPKAPRTQHEYKPRKAKTKVVSEVVPEVKENETLEAFNLGYEAGLKTAIEQAESKVSDPVQEIMVNGMYLVFNGNFSATHIQNQILKFASMLDGEEDEFYIELKLMQKSKA